MSRAIVLVFCLLATLAFTKKRHHHQAKQVEHLPHPPTAGALINHFGLQVGHGGYGPKNKVDLKKFMLRDRNGRWAVPSSAIGGPLTTATPCDISQNSYYKFCTSITDCNNCALSENCGWCDSQSKCLPTPVEDDDCCSNLCEANLVIGASQCSNNVLMGQLQHVAPDATGLRNAVYTDPKTIHTESWVEHGTKATQVQSGSKEVIREVAVHSKSDNRILNKYFKYDEPTYSTINLPYVKMNSETTVTDNATGKKLNVEGEKVNHGAF